MSKFRFTAGQRYAIWLHHGQRCWLCREPMRLAETTVDHVIPESILDTPELLAKLVSKIGLPSSFKVNGYAIHLLEAGVDLYSLSQWLGHSHVSTTTRYLHLVRPDVPDGARRTPLALLSALESTPPQPAA